MAKAKIKRCKLDVVGKRYFDIILGFYTVKKAWSIIERNDNAINLQDEKRGEQNHHPLMWFSIIGEEYGEMCKAFNDYQLDVSKDINKFEDMQREAIQIAACCIAMLECIDRQATKGFIPE